MSESRAVVITGAGGFVGSALAVGFAALGWHVTAVDLAFDDDARTRLAGLHLVTADLSGSVPNDLPAAALVVHAAATTTDPAEHGRSNAAHLAANTRPLLSMLEYAARTSPEAFLFVSSSGVFVASDGRDVLTDADLPTGRSPYAVAKRAGELITLGALDGIAAAHVVRLGYLYGPREVARPSRARTSLVAQWLAAAREGRPLAVRSDDPVRDWTFTPDLAPALARLVARPPAGRPVHLCSPFVVRDSAMAARIASHFDGAVCAFEPATAALKPPMRATDVTGLGDLRWTDPATALAQLATEETA